MPLPPDFPQSPHEILSPDARWSPDGGDMFWGKLPPLVEKLRVAVKAWRDGGYRDVSQTTAALLDWWFGSARLQGDWMHDSFRYYFAQREAIETIIYLYEAKRVKDKFDLMRFDSSGAITPGQFDEDWLRFLLIAPNIIVLDRLKKDFDGLRIFRADPVLPENGHAGRNWRDDFQLTVHLQDDVRAVHSTGNIFLTNIHRVYPGDETPPSADDEDTRAYFLGPRPTEATMDSKVNLGDIVRDIDELAVFNDEAHHIHDPKMAWFKSIEDIHNKLKQKGGGLALQVDTTAMPRHNNGAIFAQTVTDYPLMGAIAQNVVKHPVVPDSESRGKLKEALSAKFSERYADYLNLGVVEWKKASAEHDKMKQKSILFVMTDDTRNCDEVAQYLESAYPELEGAVLVIHTKKNGEISEAASGGKAKEELDLLRQQANSIDSWESPYRAVVSVLVLKEGWDVRNVTTIVGLRAYSAKSNILPEQTLGRGLRRMYPESDADEKLSVIGTEAFMKFVEDIEKEGVRLERKPMDPDSEAKAPLVIEVDKDNPNKDLDTLDLESPRLSPRIFREYGEIGKLDSKAFEHKKMPYKRFSEEERRNIVFHDIVTGEASHETKLDTLHVSDYRSIVGYFSRAIVKELHLVSAYDVVYEKMKFFIRDDLFEAPVDLEDRNTWRNLCEPEVAKAIMDAFKKSINALTVRDQDGAEIIGRIRVAETRPFVVKQQVKKSASEIYVVETKGRRDEDVPPQTDRLKQWCEDATEAQRNDAQRKIVYDCLYVDEEGFRRYIRPGRNDFSTLVRTFQE
ncbi:MAG: DEAD/DEAH box helicase family protein [Gammaproteobacteria bacterium]|nr:DEAD/DEAH box helicase family protein [Gammaproteobacteria bacterium]